ncbi:hypothetical protein H2200_010870 [Cladophialophora chaetospira]|uniref:DUF7924 domain-containing protein n=1 Tax=Cladophialophora chaetospira TaxID=386627 RepID=A0AA38X0X0_9EURO|nr:hypothetical protein H2200_010870 [Cladophialophora chaetospira]
MSSSSRSSTPSLSSDDSDLPSTSYDGSHLPWRNFRQEVLAPHQIIILDSATKERIPTSFLQIVEVANQDVSRFDDQKTRFWNQVTTGRGFGPSPIFPPNLLPPLASELLSRCMVPSFGSREALPDRAHNHAGPLYELAVPHPGLCCGFSAAAFTSRELSLIPQWLHATGTIVHWDTGYLCPGATTYCPFLTFERAYGNKEHRVEKANNQCAIDGTYSVRALQMLYAKAFKESSASQKYELPVSFSCTIDNSFALLNLHWIDPSQGQAYCMAPLCQFDLSKDVHFSKFLVWTQAIGDWALTHVLPRVKDALERLSRATSPVTPAPYYPIRRANTMPPTKLRLDTGAALDKDEILISSLKTAFGDTPWRFEDEVDSGVSSSTASWGSPMVSDFTFSNLNYPTVHPPRSNMSAPNSSVVARRRLGRDNVARSPVPPPPAYMQNQETVWQKRFNHAMDEIKELQTQLQAFQREVQGLKTSLHESSASKPAAGAPGSRHGHEDERVFIELTPMTPRAPDMATPVVTVKPSLPELNTVPEISPSPKPLAFAKPQSAITRYIPELTPRFLAFGCVTTVCVLALVKSRIIRDHGT